MNLDAVDVILRDGETLRLRPPTRADSDEMFEFFRDKSLNALRQLIEHLRGRLVAGRVRLPLHDGLAEG